MWAILPKVTHGQKKVRQPARTIDLAHQRELCLGQLSSRTTSKAAGIINNVGLNDDLQPPTSSKQSQRPEDHAPSAAFPCTPKALLAMATPTRLYLPLRSGTVVVLVDRLVVSVLPDRREPARALLRGCSQLFVP